MIKHDLVVVAVSKETLFYYPVVRDDHTDDYIGNRIKATTPTESTSNEYIMQQSNKPKIENVPEESIGLNVEVKDCLMAVNNLKMELKKKEKTQLGRRKFWLLGCLKQLEIMNLYVMQFKNVPPT